MIKLGIIPKLNIVFVESYIFEYNNTECIAVWTLESEGSFFRAICSIDTLETCEILNI